MPGLSAITSYQLPTPGELPASTAQWAPDPDRAILLVHDMQRYFLAPFPHSVWTCNGLVPVTCLSLCHLSFESQGAYAAQI